MLTQMTGSNAPPTVLMNQPRATVENQSFGNETPGQTNRNQPQTYTMQPKKSSKTWIWVLGIIGVLVLVCGGGFVGFIAWVGTLDTQKEQQNSNVLGTNTTSPTPNDRADVKTIDLSKWVMTDRSFGFTEYSNGEFIMSSSKKGFYYVLIAKNEYKTENATTKVKVRNVENAASELGFGLVVHSNPTPLVQDYGFLIDSVKQRYRVVNHQEKKENVVVNWTKSNVIKNGTQENVIEIRDENGLMNFYVNETFVTSVRNVNGYKGGVAGIYSGDMIKVAFSSFEIRK